MIATSKIFAIYDENFELPGMVIALLRMEVLLGI
jgi:hypothetical protein